MFIQFFIDLYNTICDWFGNLFVLKDKKEPLSGNAEYFNYDDVYRSSLDNTQVIL
jgi:hypothetical protein